MQNYTGKQDGHSAAALYTLNNYTVCASTVARMQRQNLECSKAAIQRREHAR
jgi:hypothetical protein